ncbi:mannosyltransferase putative-domain-containing protein [Obelidium mucronatum]|nr:mannosyltransferase putative-domain-containing protein [Obelidium mucronatum]
MNMTDAMDHLMSPTQSPTQPGTTAIKDTTHSPVEPKKEKQTAVNQNGGYLPPKKNIPLSELETDIDLLQARFLDFLNGEEGLQDSSTPYGIFGGSLQKLESPFNVRTSWNRIHQYALHVKTVPYNRSDFLALGRRARANLIANTILYDKPSLITLLALATSDKDVSAQAAKQELHKELHQVTQGLTHSVFPWIQPRYKSIHEMQKYFLDPKTREMGIVFTTGKWHFELAAHAIMTLRDLCTWDHEDLEPDMIKAFDSMPGVTTVDVLSKFSTSELGGWAIKPFAILAASFRTSIFIDADSLFFQDPEKVVRESMLFKEFGQIMIPAKWFHAINPAMSKYAGTLRYLNGLSHHEMESGVVVVDKGRTGNLHALLMVCQMNSKVEREVAYKNMHGDKETFWMTWDMIRVPYKFTPTFGGTVGYKNAKGNICGGLFHTDEYQRPLWWNGGVLANKHHHQDSGFMTFEYAAFDTDGDKIEWEWETEKTPFCLGPKDKQKEIISLSSTEKSIGAQFVQLFKDIKEVGWKKFFVTKYQTKF